jgi:hypothetical protein
MNRRRVSVRIRELPVVRVNDPRAKVCLIRDSLRMLVGLAAVRRNDARAAYWEGA